MYAISSSNSIEKGTIRETFFLSMLAQNHLIALPQKGGFLIDNQYLFEVGGKNKSFEQIKTFDNGYLVVDEIEHGIRKKIPLWLFGFLY